MYLRLYRESHFAHLSFYFYQRIFFACSHRYMAGQTAHIAVATANEVERSNILAPGLPSGTRRTHLLPAFTPECFRGLALGSRIQLQQRNCSRFARDFSRRSTFSSSQRTRSTTTRLRFRAQDLFISHLVFVSESSPNLLITGGAGFIGSNLTLALQENVPEARLTVIDDFRSGDFKNLRASYGDFVA